MYEQVAVEVGVDADITTVVGLCFSGPKDSWEEMVIEWGEDILQKSRDAGLDVEADNYTLFYLTMPCGETAAFKTLDDVPRLTTLCPYGDPGHYLVMYTDPICTKVNETSFLAGLAFDAVAGVKHETT